ncbi:HipA N-terminal domain-containing protein [Terrimonas ferruginea]|uniref:HipA N-terminal domain-containing protein n=1 Tax=Terrimonas ferruginea TaxID=249 RepID=UPI000490B323
MLYKKLKSWFSKGDNDTVVSLPKDKDARFLLKIDGIDVGYLLSKEGEWYFSYTKEFQQHQDYNLITGFSEFDKVYKSEELWPFFRIRIPGLKQPFVQEILEQEKIDKNDEVELLKRFGKRTIANPYELTLA